MQQDKGGFAFDSGLYSQQTFHDTTSPSRLQGSASVTSLAPLFSLLVWYILHISGSNLAKVENNRIDNYLGFTALASLRQRIFLTGGGKHITIIMHLINMRICRLLSG